jgi:DNA-binding LacI/PurR family transcriptional regulator
VADSIGDRPPTIRTVATRAGVSKSLVSLVLQNSPHVSEEKRQAVLKAVADSGTAPTRPHAASRSGAPGPSAS